MVLEAEYEPELVEAGVLAGLTGRSDERSFRGERDRLYEIAGAEAREAAFAALHARWFERLGLDRPFREALAEWPEVAARCGRCVVARAVAARDESADLRVAPPALPTILVRLRPETLAASERVLGLLRHELLHIADMLDPRFGYEPRLPPGGAGPIADRLLAERYRVAWDVFVDGRLARLGRPSPTSRAVRLGDFSRAFPELGDAVAAFEQFFAASRCTHADLVAFATGGATGA